MSRIGGLGAALRAGARPLLICALLGALAGFAWGLADEPEYAATATVIVVDRGEAAAQAGEGVIGGSGPAASERLIELARSEDVANLAAASLGGDVGGADLIARTEFRTGDRGGSLDVRSTASFPDFAAAAANAYAGAVIQSATALERKRLRRATDRLSGQLDELDPASEEAAAIDDKLAGLDDLAAAGPPLQPGRLAELPDAPVEDRSAAGWTLIGLLAGLFGALVFLLFGELRRRPIRTADQLEALAGAAPVGLLGPGDGARMTRRPGVFEIAPTSADRAARIAERLDLLGEARPPTLTVTSPMPGEGRTSLALGIAAAAGERGVSVLLMETDMRRPTLAELLGLDRGPGLSDYLAGAATPREVINAVPIANGDASGELPSFVCVTAGTRTDAPGGMLGGERFAALIQQLRRVYDLVIFDSPALLPAPEAVLLGDATDRTLLCVRAGLTRSSELAEALEMLDSAAVAGTVLVAGAHLGSDVRRLPIVRGSRFAEPRIRP